MRKPQYRLTRSGRYRDFQRQKVYDWERAHVFPEKEFREIMSIAECQVIVNKAYEYFGLIGPPEVHDGRGRRSACGSIYAVRLPKWARFTEVVLHEAAHGISSRLCMRIKVPIETMFRMATNGTSDEYADLVFQPGHGEVFVRIFVELLRHYGHNEFSLLSSLEESGVKWNDQSYCEPEGRST